MHFVSLNFIIFFSFAGFSTWGKKMGRKLEQLTRGDSKEHIHFPLGSTRSKKKSGYVKSTKEDLLPEPTQCDLDSSSQDPRQPRKAKIDRVESIRNLFRRSRSWDSAKDLDDVPTDDVTSTSCDLLTTHDTTDSLDPNYEFIENSDNSEKSKNVLYRSASTSVLSTHVNAANEMKEPGNEISVKLSDPIGEEVEKSGKKGSFPYAFLRSRLTSVAEERATSREECGDSGRGTSSQCGSISDIRTSYSENSDSKSFSESSDSKSSCSESSNREDDYQEEKTEEVVVSSTTRSVASPIPAPSGFGDSDYVVTVKVEGENVIPTPTSVYVKDNSESITANPQSAISLKSQTDEEKLRALDTGGCRHCPHCGHMKLKADESSLLPVRRRHKSHAKQRPRTISSNIASQDSLYETIFPAPDNKRSSLSIEALDNRLQQQQQQHHSSRLSIALQNNSLESQNSEGHNSRSASLDRTASWRLSSADVCGRKESNEGSLCPISNGNRYRRRAPSLPRVSMLSQVSALTEMLTQLITL